MGRTFIWFDNRFIVCSNLRKEIAQPKKYVWEREDYNEDDDEFLKHFDDNGNFIEHKEPDPETSEEEEPPTIKYTLKKAKEKWSTIFDLWIFTNNQQPTTNNN